MLLIDVNVWINASHKEAVQHEIYERWLAETYRAAIPYAVTDLVAAAFLRITTNPKAFIIPYTMEQAVLAWDDIISRSMCTWISPAETHWARFRNLCKVSAVRGNLVNDAWLAALAIEHNCELISADRDFAKFPGLRWRHPLAPPGAK
jgi:uncharacterized protein